MSVLGGVHTAFAVTAIVLGGLILIAAKGTSRHRVLGWSYLASMAGMLASSFFIYRLTRSFNALHGFSIWAVLTLCFGLVPAYRKRGRMWLDRHYYWMTYSYAGLLAALVAEIATRQSGQRFVPAFLISSGVVLVAGALIIYRRRLTTLAQMRARWIR